jgi:hypothetical protein
MCIVVLGSEEIPTFKPSSKSPHIIPGFINICCLIGMKLQQICEEVKLVFRFQKKISTMWTALMHKLYKVCITGSPSASNNSLGAYNILFPIESSLSLPYP